MTHDEAAKIYDSYDDCGKRFFGVYGILFHYFVMPNLIKLMRGLVNEKNN